MLWPAATANSFSHSSSRRRISSSMPRPRKTSLSLASLLFLASSAPLLHRRPIRVLSIHGPSTHDPSKVRDAALLVGDGFCSFLLAPSPRAWSFGFPCNDPSRYRFHPHRPLKWPKIGLLLRFPLRRNRCSPFRVSERRRINPPRRQLEQPPALSRQTAMPWPTSSTSKSSPPNKLLMVTQRRPLPDLP